MTKTTIFQNQTGLLLRNGSVVKTLGAGTYKTYKFRNEAILTYPAYSQTVACTVLVRTQEVALMNVATRIGVMIEDTKTLYMAGMTIYEVVTNAITKQLQSLVGAMKLSEVLEKNLTIDIDALNSEIAEYGLRAKVELEPTVQLPRNLQNAIDAQEVARQRAKAELEEARGRTAVIRHYANVAKATQDNPDLLRLLLGQKAKAINVAFDAPAKANK